MPRIRASTVVEHHARQRRALLDAARELLGETSQAPSMGAVGARAGLARSSVYQYFGSGQELLAAVVADLLPSWASRVRERVAAAGSAGEQVWAYIEANIELFAGPEQDVARALAQVVEPRELQGPMEDFHAQLQVPLRDALERLGESDPATMAGLIEATVVRACQGLRSPDGRREDETTASARTHLHRLLGPYLGLPPGPLPAVTDSA